MPEAEPDQSPWGTFRPNLPARALIEVSRQTPLGRGLLRKRMAQLLFRLHSGPVDAWLWGHKVRLFPKHNVCERKALLRPDRLDPSEYAFVRTALSRPRQVFVDVGANAGLYSLYAALNAAEGTRILAIEPDAALLARLVFNIRLTAAWRPAAVELATAAVAVGDYDGQGLLSGNGDEGSQSLLPNGKGRCVPVRRLAGLLQEHAINSVSLMKIDVEGYEDRVLPPYLAEVSSDRWPQSIIIEHVYRTRWSVDCISLCEERGYRICASTNNNTLLVRAALRG
jgi:FkbM family methyltransferase